VTEMIEKYQDLARRVVGDFATKLILERTLNLEKVLDMRTFFDGFLSKGG